MGYPVENKRNAVIGSLAFAVLIPLTTLAAISHYARRGPEYVHALAFAMQAPEVVAALGEPIDDGLMPTIKWPMSTDKPTVYVNMSLKGPNGKGTMALTEVRQPGGWQVVDACWTYAGASKKLGSEGLPVADVSRE